MNPPWDRRSDQERERVESLLLRSWLPAVAEASPYWSERVRALGIPPGDFDTRAELAQVTPVREVDIRRAGGEGAPALVIRPTEEQVKARAPASVLSGIARSIRREGSDGIRRILLQEYKPIHVHRGGATNELAIAYSRSDLDRFHRCGARAAAVLGLDDTDYLVSAVPMGPTVDFFGIYHLALGASMLALHPRGHGDPLEKIIEAFALLPATTVAVQAREAAELAELLEASGASAARVDTIVSVGPPPSAEARELIREAWILAGANDDLRVLAAFAPKEGRALWAEAREGGGLVTYPDLEVLELVDPVTGEPADEAGELCITSAGWHGTALLRFRTGVYVDGLDSEPQDDRRVPRLTGEIEPSAWQPPFQGSDGAGVVDLRGVPAAMAGLPVTTWRAEVRGPTTKIKHDRLIVEVAGRLRDHDVAELDRRLTSETGVVPERINVVEDDVAVDARAAQLGSALADLR